MRITEIPIMIAQAGTIQIHSIDDWDQVRASCNTAFNRRGIEVAREED